MVHQVKGAAAKPLFSETLQRMTSAMHGITLSGKTMVIYNSAYRLRKLHRQVSSVKKPGDPSEPSDAAYQTEFDSI
jgi:hypothetical protein